MKKISFIFMSTFIMAYLIGCGALESSKLDNSNNVEKEILQLEKSALTRWNNGDTDGFLELYSKDVSYFDESTKARYDGFDKMKKYYEPLKGKIYSDHFEMISPLVQVDGNIAVLSYNLKTYSKSKMTSHWNSTEVFANIDGSWKIIHSHWSFVD